MMAAEHLNGGTRHPAAWELPDRLEGRAVGGAELLAEGEGEPDFVVAGLVEREDVVLLTGREKEALKTWAVIDLGVAVILGASWLGFATRACQPARVLLISCETSARNVARRLRALCAGRGIAAERVARYFYVMDEPVSLVPREDRERAFERAERGAKLSALKIPDGARRDSLKKSAATIGEREARALGRNLDALAAIEGAPHGTWGLILIDTLRQCLVGDENSSQDAARFTQACRELARAAGCPVVVTHHTNKSGDASDARSSRGSVELTAGPDVLLSVDTSGDWPTAHAKLRNHEEPEPFGYALSSEGDGMRLVRRDPALAARKGSKVDDGEILELLQAHAGDALTLAKVRQLVAERSGGKPGAKAAPRPIEQALDRLVAAKRISKVPIRTRDGRTFEGYRVGTDTSPDRAKRVSSASSFDDLEDV